MTSPIRPAFLEGMSRAAQTVCIVTTDGPAGRGGVTVSTLTSVSADTAGPTLLICVHHTASAAPLILANARFCVTILAADQSAVADAFAGRRKDLTDRFSVADWVPMPSGALRLTQAMTAFDCTLIHHNRVGTHDIFMAEVQDVHLGEAAPPLTYANRAYGHPTPLPQPQGTAMAHTRHRKFNTRDTYPEQKLDNDLAQAVVARGTTIFLRGQCPQEIETARNITSHDPVEQTHKVMQNIRQLIEECGGRMEHLCKVVVYLTDIRHREAVYRTMGEYIKGVHPVSTGVVVTALARPEWLVEIDATAVIPD